MRVRVVDDPTLVSIDQDFHKLLSIRVEKEKLTNAYPGKSRGTHSVSTFVVEGLDGTGVC